MWGVCTFRYPLPIASNNPNLSAPGIDSLWFLETSLQHVNIGDTQNIDPRGHQIMVSISNGVSYFASHPYETMPKKEVDHRQTRHLIEIASS